MKYTQQFSFWYVLAQFEQYSSPKFTYWSCIILDIRLQSLNHTCTFSNCYTQTPCFVRQLQQGFAFCTHSVECFPPMLAVYFASLAGSVVIPFFVGSNHYVIAEKFPYVQSSSDVDLANRCRITRSLSFRKIVV